MNQIVDSLKDIFLKIEITLNELEQKLKKLQIILNMKEKQIILKDILKVESKINFLLQEFKKLSLNTINIDHQLRFDFKSKLKNYLSRINSIKSISLMLSEMIKSLNNQWNENHEINYHNFPYIKRNKKNNSLMCDVTI